MNTYWKKVTGIAKMFNVLFAVFAMVFVGVVMHPMDAHADSNRYPYGQCTWFVWNEAKNRLNYEMPWFSGKSGNGKNWLSSARAHGLSTGTQPVGESVAVYSGGVYDDYCDGTCGHVAYVTKVSGGDMWINEGNPNHWDLKVPSQVGTWRGNLKLEGFIYLPGGGKPSASPDPNKTNLLPEVPAPIGMWTFTPKTATGERLDLAGATAGNGVAIQRYKANGTVAQQWYVQNWKGAFIRSAQSGKVVDVTGGNIKAGTNIQAYSLLEDGIAQRWKFYDAGDGYRVICLASNKNLCLDVNPSRSRVQLHQYVKGYTSQMWKIGGVAESPAPGVYVLESVYKPDSRLDVKDESKAATANVQLNNTANGHDSQGWAITKASGSWYNLQNVNSGLNLDVKGGGTSYSNQQNVQQWTPGTQDAQWWMFQKAPTGYYLQAAHSGKYLDLVTSNNNVSLFDLNAGKNQQWKLIRVADPITPGKYRIVPKHAQDKRLRAVGSGAGANVEIRTANNSSCEYKWTLVPTNANNTEFHIKNECGGFLMDVHNNGTANGTNVGVWNDNGNDAQKFTFQRAGDGWYYIRATNGTYVDIQGGHTDDGTNVQVYNFFKAKNEAQMFRLEPVVDVSSISISGPTTLTKGGWSRYTANVLPDNADNKAVTWKSSDTSVATVDANGKVTGKEAGVVTITATAKDGSKKSGSLKITVKAASTPKPKPQPSGSVLETVTMLRLYNKATGEHFYTSDVYEKNTLVKKHGWTYEGVAWIAPKKSSAPVYRLYNKVSGDHHYTMSSVEMNALVKKHGWTYEGVGWYSDTSKRVKVYRAYNPRLRVGSHHYTTDVNEYRALYMKHGWRGENTAWYAVRVK